jgi:predicted enzyme related to lactoylglutathione lyase
MDSIVHFEIPADDLKRASAFYKKAFGWSVEQFEGMDYWGLTTTQPDDQGRPKEPGAINGGMGKREGPLKGIVVTIAVDDIDSALSKIEKLGGKSVQKKQPVGEMGFTAYFKDTEGNTVGLWQNAGQM